MDLDVFRFLHGSVIDGSPTTASSSTSRTVFVTATKSLIMTIGLAFANDADSGMLDV